MFLNCASTSVDAHCLYIIHNGMLHGDWGVELVPRVAGLSQKLLKQ